RGPHGDRERQRRRPPRAGPGQRGGAGMIAESEAWDRELSERATPAPLLQSWAWGEVQSRAGWKVERVLLPSGAMASAQIRKAGPASEVYVPRGPVPATPEAVDGLVE